MATPLEITRQYFDALGNGDMATVNSLLADDCVWHQPGSNRFSGQHVGPGGIRKLVNAMMEATDGTFRVAGAGAPMVNGTLVAAPVRFQGSRNGASLDMGGIDLLTVEHDRIVRVDLFSEDAAAEDAFWGK